MSTDGHPPLLIHPAPHPPAVTQQPPPVPVAEVRLLYNARHAPPPPPFPAPSHGGEAAAPGHGSAPPAPHQRLHLGAHGGHLEPVYLLHHGGGGGGREGRGAPGRGAAGAAGAARLLRTLLPPPSTAAASSPPLHTAVTQPRRFRVRRRRPAPVFAYHGRRCKDAQLCRPRRLTSSGR